MQLAHLREDERLAVLVVGVLSVAEEVRVRGYLSVAEEVKATHALARRPACDDVDVLGQRQLGAVRAHE
eukprot:scaffold55815_cov33-Phaeocystis_antarctica.AAC.1